MGPGVPPLGIRQHSPATQSQIAATLAALVGVDFSKGSSQAAEPLSLAPTQAGN
jgi:hypothetical protein